MLNAAALFTGLWLIFVLATQAWMSPRALVIAALAAMAGSLIGLRIGGASSAFARAPRSLLTAGARMGAVVGGAVATIRAAIAADITLNPALVHVRTRARHAADRAAFAAMLGAAPGLSVVQIESDGILTHALDEDRVDAAELGALEASVLGRAQ